MSAILDHTFGRTALKSRKPLQTSARRAYRAGTTYPGLTLCQIFRGIDIDKHATDMLRRHGRTRTIRVLVQALNTRSDARRRWAMDVFNAMS